MTNLHCYPILSSVLSSIFLFLSSFVLRHLFLYLPFLYLPSLSSFFVSHAFVYSLLSWISSSCTGICFIMCLFSFPAKLESLKYTSAFGFLSLSYLLGVIVYRFLQRVEEPDWKMPKNVPAASMTGVSFAITTQLGAFSAVFNTVAAQAELPKDLQLQGLGSVVPLIATGTAFLFYIFFGVCGYLTLNGDPPRDILTGFSNKDKLMSCARLAVCAVSIFKAPLVCNPLKMIVSNFFTCLPTDDTKRTLLVTPMVYAIAFGVSSLIPDPSTVFGYVSAVGVNITMFVLPGLCLRSVGVIERKMWLQVCGWMLSLLGVVVAVMGLYATVEYHPHSGTRVVPSPSL